MPDNSYRIKLYGHSSDNPDFFLVELGAVLEISPESARALLSSTPAVIKEGISLEEAEHLQDLLTLIKALCIVEPTDEAAEPDQDAPDISKQYEALKKDKEEKEEKETLRSYAWTGAAALIAATILIWLTGTFFSSYFRSSAENNSKQPPAKKEEASENPVPPKTPSSAANLSDLYKQMDSADQKIQNLEFQLNLAEQELQRLYSTYKVDPNLIRDKKIEAADFKQKLREEKNAFKLLRTQVNAIEAMSKQSSN